MSRWLLEIPRTSRSCSVNSTRGFTCEAICWISRMSASYTAQHSHCNNTYTATTYCTSRQLLRWVQLSTIPSVCYSVWNRETLRCWLDALQQHSDCSNIYTATTLTLQQHCHCNNTYAATTLTLQQHLHCNNTYTATTLSLQQHLHCNNTYTTTTLTLQQHSHCNNTDTATTHRTSPQLLRWVAVSTPSSATHCVAVYPHNVLQRQHLLLQHNVLQCINNVLHTPAPNTYTPTTHALPQHTHCHNAYTATTCRVSLMASFHRKNGHQAHFSDFFNLEAIWNSDYRAVRVAPTEGERKRVRQKRRERKKERQMWKGRERDGNFHYLSQERETYRGSKDI